MKTIRSILTATLALALLSLPARAVTFQVVADTAGTPTVGAVAGTIKKAAGTATTLPVTAKSSAFINFEVGNSGINPNAVTGARLVIFFPKVTKPGNLKLFANDKAFSEVFATTTIPIPGSAGTIGNPIVLIVADSKNFFTIDVTAQVKAWLTTPATDFGFGISADSPTSLVNATIGSKEGSGSGYPAVLEVDVNDSGPIAVSSATFSGNVGIGAGAGSLGRPLDTALSTDGVTTGVIPTGSLALELTNTDTNDNNGNTTNVVGIGFGRSGLTTQAIVGGTFGADFLQFFVGSNATKPQMTITNDVSVANNLNVGGDIQENAKSVPEAEEKLRIIRGTINANGTIAKGSGFTINSPHSTSSYTITFTTAFSDTPSITTGILQPNSASPVTIPTVSSSSFLVNTFSGNNAADVPFSFIAVGPR